MQEAEFSSKIDETLNSLVPLELNRGKSSAMTMSDYQIINAFTK